MSAAKLKLVIEKGATFRPRFTYKDTAGVIQNLTGYTAEMHIRATLESATTIVTLTTANGGIVLGGVAGTIDLLILPAVTTAIVEEEGVYDLEITSGAGVKTRVIEGKVIFKPEVTRP